MSTLFKPRRALQPDEPYNFAGGLRMAHRYDESVDSLRTALEFESDDPDRRPAWTEELARIEHSVKLARRL